MEPLYRWSWPGIAWGYLWLVLVAALLVRRRRRAPEGKRPGLVAPLAFCAAVTALQQMALVAAIATRLVQTWQGQAAFGAGMAALLGGAILWLRGQTRGRPYPVAVFVGALALAALLPALFAVNGSGWSEPPRDRPTRILAVEQRLGGPIAYWFVRLEGLGDVAVEPSLAQLLGTGGPAVAKVGVGRLGALRLEGSAPPGAPQ